MEQERGQSSKAAQRLRQTDFPIVFRGYDKESVDRYVADVLRIATELEATQSRDTIVQRALEEVGEETSGILQRAHQTAEEVTARARSQAEGRMQRAEREAETTVAEAKAEAERLRAELVTVWRQRERLIDDLRRFSDEILAVADDALERLEPPAEAEGADAAPEPEVAQSRPTVRIEDPGVAGEAAPEDAVPPGDSADSPQAPEDAPTEVHPPAPGPPPVPGELPSVEGPAVRRVGPEHRTR